MTDSRTNILAKASGLTERRDRAVIATEAAALIKNRGAFQPGFGGSSLRERFVEKATSERVTASVECLDDIVRLPEAVLRYLQRNGLPERITLQPRSSLLQSCWDGIRCQSNPDLDETVALTLAEKGVAETGSVVFRTAPDAPVLMNFLSLHHLVVLFEKDLLAYLEDVFSWTGTSPADQPRSLNIITGTSGTADIEAKNVRGAHGPRFMHIFLITVTDLDSSFQKPAGRQS